MVKTKKNINKKKTPNKQSKKKKYFKGGEAGGEAGTDALANFNKTKNTITKVKEFVGKKRFGGDTTECDMAIKLGKLEKKGFLDISLRDMSSKNLLKQLKISKLVDEKYEVYIKDYLLVAFNNFCIKKDEKKFINYCYNILGCLKEIDHINELFINLYKMNPVEEQSVTKNYNNKNIYNKTFKKTIEKNKIRNFSMFIVGVLVKSIKEFEKASPAKKNKLSIKIKLDKIFKDLKLFEFEKVTAEALNKKLSEDSSKEYFHKLKGKNKENKENNKKNDKGTGDIDLDLKEDENRSSSFLYFMAGMTLFGFLLNLNLLSEPPNVVVKGGFF